MTKEKTRVLVVDDIHLISFATALRVTNFEVTYQSSYVDALKAIQTNDFDIALLDINLSEHVPNRDKLGVDAKVAGFLLAEKIREKGEMPVVFMSASLDDYVAKGTCYYQEDSLIRYKEVAIQFYPFNFFDKKNLVKPTAINELLKVIQLTIRATSLSS